MRKSVVGAAVIAALVVVAGFTVYEYYQVPGQSPCQPLVAGSPERGQTAKTTFGAVTEYGLPGVNRLPNAIVAEADGSVWFAVQEVPGVAHLFPSNGTVVEYAWPGYPAPKPPYCNQVASVSGMALWNGRVWAADEFGNAVVGLNPGDGSTVSVNTTGRAELPYWLAAGPDGSLWFTSNNFPGQPTRLGRILPNMTLSVISLIGLGYDQPVQLEFVNSTFALLSTLNESTNSTTHLCVCTGHVYSFNPESVSSSLTPATVGGDYPLSLPTSISFSAGEVWVALHGAAGVAAYNFTSRSWSLYPTSLVSFSGTTLPLEVDASGGVVWFNEHIANKIARLDPVSGTLTEYSESDPPASSSAGIQNDLSIAATPAGAWFTSLSGNYVGFADGTWVSPFTVSAAGPGRLSLAPGGSASFNVSVSGSWSRPLGVNVSDSEDATSVPQQIRIIPAVSSIPAGGSGSFHLGVEVQVGANVRPGSYTIAVTVTDGGVQQTAYAFVDVG